MLMHRNGLYVYVVPAFHFAVLVQQRGALTFDNGFRVPRRSVSNKVLHDCEFFRIADFFVILIVLIVRHFFTGEIELVESGQTNLMMH